jgi:two-component sensor histidine kinase
LQEATASAKESDEKSAAKKGESSHVLAAPEDPSAGIEFSHDQPGEGIGLSIVKRLCELLDASLEIASDSGRGHDVPRRLPAPLPDRPCHP